jgi:signal peptidase I
MGLPGETIEIRENRVFINGEALPVKTLNRADFAWVPLARPPETLFENEDAHWIMHTPGRSEYQNHYSVRLAAGQYFLLGDNRDDSYDSRAFGPVSEDRILGKMIYVFRTGPRW